QLRRLVRDYVRGVHRIAVGVRDRGDCRHLPDPDRGVGQLARQRRRSHLETPCDAWLARRLVPFLRLRPSPRSPAGRRGRPPWGFIVLVVLGSASAVPAASPADGARTTMTTTSSAVPF